MNFAWTALPTKRAGEVSATEAVYLAKCPRNKAPAARTRVEQRVSYYESLVPDLVPNKCRISWKPWNIEPFRRIPDSSRFDASSLSSSGLATLPARKMVRVDIEGHRNGLRGWGRQGGAG